MPDIKLISPVTHQAVRKLRVAAYCRVSSNSADQLNSYSRQVRVYSELINQNPDWEMVEVFADEGISGTSADARPEFMRMIQMCELRKIDLIVTKSVSRFARNVKEGLEYVRELKLLGIGVQFEKEGINSLALGDEMLLNTFSAIAQEESQAISQNQRLAAEKRMASGEYISSNVPYGFRLVDKKLVICESEAEVVRWIFNAYLSGWSSYEIARDLSERGVPTSTGKAVWKTNRITYILGNERYVGDMLFQKYYNEPTVPFKKRKNRGEKDQYYASGTHEPILDTETFAKVQHLLTARIEKYGNNDSRYTYPLTSRIHCSECGSFYQRKIRGSTIKWVCSLHKSDAAACRSNYISEDRIYDGIIAIINKLRFGSGNILEQVIVKLDAAVTTYKLNNSVAGQCSSSIAELNAKLLMLEELRSKGYLAEEVFQTQARTIRNELNDLKTERSSAFESRLLTMASDVRKLSSLLRELEAPLESFNEKLFLETVESISISKTDEMTVTFIGGLKFTELI